MKKENFTLKLNTPWRRLASLSILPVFLMLFAFNASAQCPLGCNNNLQISLDNDCSVTVTPDMILEGQGTDASCDYMVEILDANDNIIPGSPVVDGDYIGMTLKARVRNGLNSCWGYITIEDKLRPTIDCDDIDVTISCYETYNDVLPSASDNCGDVTVVAISNELDDMDCNAQWSAVRTIVYQAEDSSGNLSEPCTRTVYYERIGLEDLYFPQHFDGIDGRPTLSCEQFTSWDEDDAGYPHFNVVGAPSTDAAGLNTILPNNPTYCELNATFTDQVLPICESSFKVLRTYTVLDWCEAGAIRTENQIIKVVDHEGPEVTTLQDEEFAAQADPYTCLGTFQVPAPVVVNDCASWTYTVAYATPLEDGSAPANGIYYTENIYPNGPLGPDNGLYTITGLPLGTNWLRYTLTDDCGNVTEAFTEVEVVDNVPPVAICDEFTVVTLTSNGRAYIYAPTFDDGSYDNCSDIELHVRRMSDPCNQPDESTAFRDYVEFCCADVGQDVQVELRVREVNGGLTNSCMVTVHVQDKIDPVIECPDDRTVECSVFDIDGDYGSPEGNDNCDNYTITRLADIDNRDQCGVGIVTRRWRITDAGGRTDQCSQRIYVENSNPFNGNNINHLRWPANEDLTGCMNDNTDPSQTGEPIINAPDCSLVAWTHSDKVFNFQDGACFKILRTFTVIDWCQYDDNNTGGYSPGIWQHTQVIKLNNTVAPEFDNCNNYSACIYGDDCRGFVEMTQSATDDCAHLGEEDLVFSYAIDYFNDGSINATGSGNDASRTMDIGTHKITWTVEDKCGNQSICSQLVTVNDCKKPTPYCITDITTVVMPTTGMVQIWASDFDHGSFDNCPGELRFTFANGSTSMTFDCDDEGMNDIDIYVTDAAGNSDFCTTTINIQVNGGCEGARIAGQISTEVASNVGAVEVMLEDMESHDQRMFMTDETGHFQFFNIAEHSDYQISASKNDDHSNGVSTLDLVMIQRHILGFSEFTSPYKVIAADINNNNSVSAADVTELRKIILGIQDEFNNNKSWRFVDNSQVFAEIDQPWPYTEVIDVDDFISNDMDNNFVAIKIGDVNDSAESNATQEESEVRSAVSTDLVVMNQEYLAGERVEVPVTAENFESLLGMQFTLKFDESALEYTSVEAGSMNMTAANIGATLAERGEIAASWTKANGLTADKDEVLFTLVFRAKTNGNLSTLAITADQIKPETYTNTLEINSLNLTVRNAANEIASEMTLIQNKPNPFSDYTTISFNLPKAGEATLSIYDIRGAKVVNLTKSFERGQNNVEVNASQLNTKGGVYYYTLEYNGQVATKKMILLSK